MSTKEAKEKASRDLQQTAKVIGQIGKRVIGASGRLTSALDALFGPLPEEEEEKPAKPSKKVVIEAKLLPPHTPDKK